MLAEQPTSGTHGMVAAAHYLATQAGLHILQQGGNAVDAALATNVAMTVVYPSTCSAGGDIFMLIWEAKTQQLHALNGSGRAPTGLTPEYFAARRMQQIPTTGPLSINVPGAVDGWFEALGRFGSLSAEEIFAPAIEFAEEGVPVTPKLSGWLKRAARTVLGPYDMSAAIFLPGGKAPGAGDILHQPHLARTYKTLVREGRDAFYRGPLARTITQYVQRIGGVLRVEDMAAHHSDWVRPISTQYRDYDVYEFPPNSQGITALEMLNIIEGYDLRSLGYQSAEYLHILLEAKKLAFADRDRYISDPTFVDIPVERLISKAYAEQQRARINLKRAARQIGPGLEKEGDTTYLCTVDRAGNVVSLIQSLYNGFGSGVVGGDTGVLLHNRGSYFSLDPRHVNYLQPGKRTMHTLTPAMVLRNSRPIIVLGSMGGDAQRRCAGRSFPQRGRPGARSARPPYQYSWTMGGWNGSCTGNRHSSRHTPSSRCSRSALRWTRARLVAHATLNEGYMRISRHVSAEARSRPDHAWSGHRSQHIRHSVSLFSIRKRYSWTE